MTDLELFTKIQVHMLSGQCGVQWYRDNGLPNAIGVLIPDERYSSALENQTVGHPSVREAIDQFLPPKDQRKALYRRLSMLTTLQKVNERIDKSRWPVLLEDMESTFENREWCWNEKRLLEVDKLYGEMYAHLD